MVKFPCLVCEKAVGTNHNAVCCDMCDTWVHIYCNNICKERHRDLKKDQTPWSCKSCIRKEIPFSSLNDTELAHPSKGISVPPNRKDKLPATIVEKLNVFTEHEDIKCKYYTKDQRNLVLIKTVTKCHLCTRTYLLCSTTLMTSQAC